ncbi:MAG TPA: hypothetical protein VFZ22_17230 [Pyrinomonadaceae bacterium]|nr:hypothetical protein [Pyrinomonadaceae bacterium]
MSKGNGHRTETPDVSHIRNVEVAHEPSDVSVRGVGTFVLVLTLATITIGIGLWFLFTFFNSDRGKERAPGPMSLRNLSEEQRLPPAPRLQAQKGFGVTLEDGQFVDLRLREPQAEYRELKKQWDTVLSTGLKDQSGNTVGIPIDQAIDKITSGEGLPARTKQAPGKLEDYAITMPSQMSSGRETIKKLQ